MGQENLGGLCGSSGNLSAGVTKEIMISPMTVDG